MAAPKPFGIIAISIYYALFALFAVPSFFLGMAVSELSGSLLDSIIAILLLVAAVVAIAGIYGLWTMQDWGRITIICIALLSGIYDIVSIIRASLGEGAGMLVLTLFDLIVSAAVILYLTRMHVEARFSLS